ncbi:hypothetical protein E2C01_010160 [Portunus trituberculatus]|uniref:Uncharacterized protein n=1 Tax=Portunus trituberculatus TaxID=210409 RepID=A0A5B7D7P7_PORTR|nr:hypothetical protein [Portunus trituberculatus]
MERSQKNVNYPRVYAFNTFFYPKLSKSGYHSVRRWTKKGLSYKSRACSFAFNLNGPAQCKTTRSGSAGLLTIWWTYSGGLWNPIFSLAGDLQDLVLQGKMVGVFMDNITALAYLSHHGGIHSLTLNDEVQRMLRWAEDRAIVLRPQLISGSHNTVADSLSQESQVISMEWTLWQLWGMPLVDLFTTSQNFRLPAFVSLLPNPMAIATDAFLILGITWIYTPFHRFWQSGNFFPSSGCHGGHPSSSLYRSGHAGNGSQICYRRPSTLPPPPSTDKFSAAVSLPSLPRQSPHTLAGCVETVQQLRYQGYSQKVAKFLVGSRQHSTIVSYQYKLSALMTMNGSSVLFMLCGVTFIGHGPHLGLGTFFSRSGTPCTLSKMAISYFLWQLIQTVHEDFPDHLGLTSRPGAYELLCGRHGVALRRGVLGAHEPLCGRQGVALHHGAFSAPRPVPFETTAYVPYCWSIFNLYYKAINVECIHGSR